MSACPKYTLESLSTEAEGLAVKKAEVYSHQGYGGWGFWGWFIVIAIIIGILFFLFRPTFVLSVDPNTGQYVLDFGKLIIWSLVIALIIVVILWLLRGAFGGYGRGYEHHEHKHC